MGDRILEIKRKMGNCSIWISASLQATIPPDWHCPYLHTILHARLGATVVGEPLMKRAMGWCLQEQD